MSEGKFGIFDRQEDRALELMVGEKKSAIETANILKTEGFKVSPAQLRTVKKKSFDKLLDEEKQEVMSDFLLDSIKKVMFKFEDLYGKFEEMYANTDEDDSFNKIVVLRELKSMLHMSLKRLGEYKQGIENIKVQNLNIISNSDVMVAIQENQDKWFDEMGPEVTTDGKLIFTKPSPEVLDGFYKWRFRSGKSKVF